ncbi:hypothetical protein EDC57_1992 [Inmirania thermothiophila]|uniref:Uncharacterized protein n=1 Tax=Inmirania thermothiophila TaxID=1750597 RepID=A0A3N1Y1T3_9GAMM|nr:hypothetical protein EDC57_1992 [Inmirania thermothiophila]
MRRRRNLLLAWALGALALLVFLSSMPVWEQVLSRAGGAP